MSDGANLVDRQIQYPFARAQISDISFDSYTVTDVTNFPAARRRRGENQSKIPRVSYHDDIASCIIGQTTTLSLHSFLIVTKDKLTEITRV